MQRQEDKSKKRVNKMSDSTSLIVNSKQNKQ